MRATLSFDLYCLQEISISSISILPVLGGLRLAIISEIVTFYVKSIVANH